MNLFYILHLADDALILGHRISEWCGHGPILEQDIALTNTALDHLGRARNLYQYAAELFNQLPEAEQKNCFTSLAIQAIVDKGEKLDEDDLAYLRDSWDFRNNLITEQVNGDWARTVARSFYCDTFNYYYYKALVNSADTALAAIAEKSLKEVTYHMRWSSEWVIRLGDGTDESAKRMQQAINDLWPFTGEFFVPGTFQSAGKPDLNEVKQQWMAHVAATIGEAMLTLPAEGWMQKGGKEGQHSEHLGYLLAEMQFMQRVYPGMEW
jgi:ring-1,2-phenylacetyl-CoA epoxidase subunit PaaC